MRCFAVKLEVSTRTAPCSTLRADERLQWSRVRHYLFVFGHCPRPGANAGPSSLAETGAVVGPALSRSRRERVW